MRALCFGDNHRALAERVLLAGGDHRACSAHPKITTVAPRDRVTLKPVSFSMTSVLSRLYPLVLALRGADGIAAIAPRDRVTLKPDCFSLAGALSRFDQLALAAVLPRFACPTV